MSWINVEKQREHAEKPSVYVEIYIFLRITNITQDLLDS